MTTENIKKHNLDFLLLYIFSASHECLASLLCWWRALDRASHETIIARCSNSIEPWTVWRNPRTHIMSWALMLQPVAAFDVSMPPNVSNRNKKLFFPSYSYLNIFFWVEKFNLPGLNRRTLIRFYSVFLESSNSTTCRWYWREIPDFTTCNLLSAVSFYDWMRQPWLTEFVWHWTGEEFRVTQFETTLHAIRVTFERFFFLLARDSHFHLGRLGGKVSLRK